MAVGMNRPDSDIDVFCIGRVNSKLKTEVLDLVSMTEETLLSSGWLSSELALHVRQYGVLIKGRADWLSSAQLTTQTVEAKRRRVGAFMRSLPHSWASLEQGFRIKYAIKLRREMQRLLLLEQGVAVPPTRMLDAGGTERSSQDAVCNTLSGFIRCRAELKFSEEFFPLLLKNWCLKEGTLERH